MSIHDIAKIYKKSFPELELKPKFYDMIEEFTGPLGEIRVKTVLQGACNTHKTRPEAAFRLFREMCTNLIRSEQAEALKLARKWILTEADVTWLTSCRIKKTVKRKRVIPEGGAE